ncbi:MAG: sulfatase-like hydrolase/transferase [Bryobacteraceae bacterium]|nr:sulfatase-like hydrolase/transferase [Bryobacteraceae bacterium]
MTSRRHLLTSAAGVFAPAPPPNVLVILCDQLNASATGLYGGPVSTPNLERLARNGVVFNQATCPTPFCSPSRASIVTGLYPHSHGVVHNLMRKDYPTEGGPQTEEGITRQDRTLDSLLHAAGYATHQCQPTRSLRFRLHPERLQAGRPPTRTSYAEL